MNTMRTVILLAVAMSLAASGQIGKGVNFYSQEKEIALGESMAAEAGTTPFANPAVQQYVESLGARLAARLPEDAPAFTYTFRVVSDDLGGSTHEPGAFPGGIILVPVGLILAAQEEAEVAGMLAHAIVHVAARHGTRAETRAQISEQASIPLIFMGGWTGYGIRQAAQLAIPLGMVTFARGFETQADKEAVRILSVTGYDPSALARYVERTQVDPQSRTSQTFSPMPLRETRLNALRAAIAQLSEFDEIQELVRRAN